MDIAAAEEEAYVELENEVLAREPTYAAVQQNLPGLVRHGYDLEKTKWACWV